MAGLALIPLPPGRTRQWDEFVAASANGSLFHRQDFLGYHGDRFREAARPLVWLKGEALFAVLPLALFTENGVTRAVSPFGASFGGIVHGANLRLKHALEMADSLVAHLRELGVAECSITTPPQCYHRHYTGAMEFALCSRGFTLANREITHAIPLAGVTDPFQPLDSGTRTQARKAAKLGVTVERDASIAEAYPLMVKTREQLGNPNLTHSLADLQALQAINPDFVKVDLARLEGTPVAANVFLCSPTCITSFYPSYIKEYAHTSALTLLMLDAIRWCLETGRQHLDLGCTSYRMAVNPSLSEFKESFGATCHFRDTFRMSL